jgi:hypothetical protein
MNRVSDLKNYISSTYPALPKAKFDIAKIGARIYIYLVDRRGNLQREPLFRGALPTVNELPVLRKQLEANIKDVMTKWEYVNN